MKKLSENLLKALVKKGQYPEVIHLMAENGFMVEITYEIDATGFSTDRYVWKSTVSYRLKGTEDLVSFRVWRGRWKDCVKNAVSMYLTKRDDIASSKFKLSEDITKMENW